MIRTDRQRKRERLRRMRRKKYGRGGGIGGAANYVYNDEFTFGLGPEWVLDSGVMPIVGGGVARFETNSTLRNTQLSFAPSIDFDLEVSFPQINWSGDNSEEIFDFDNLEAAPTRDSIGFTCDSIDDEFTLKAYKIVDGVQTDIGTVAGLTKGTRFVGRISRINGIATWKYSVTGSGLITIGSNDVSAIDTNLSFRFVVNNAGLPDDIMICDYVRRFS